MKRAFDILVSALALVVLSPLFLVLSLWIVADGRGGPFFLQTRTGRNEQPFRLCKFRTMRPDADKKGKLTIGGRDPRITPTGRFLRKYKLDELPQLWNVLKGDMSFVGPRPEVPEYTRLYDEEQKKVLSVRPGLTDKASLAYFREDELLARAEDPEQEYLHRIMPEKLRLNREYIRERTFFKDLGILFKTVSRILR